MSTALNNTLRKDVYTQANSRVQYVFSDPSSGKRLREISQKFNFYRTNQYGVFATTIGDIILGFYKIEDTVPLLQQELGLDPKTAALLGAEVIEFLAPLSDPNWQPPVEASDNEGEKVVTANAPAPTIPTKAPVLDMPTSLPGNPVVGAAVPSVHTYADDLSVVRGGASVPSYEPTPDEAPVYSSEQPQRQPLSTLPSYGTQGTYAPVVKPHAPDRPKWSSEL